MKRRTVLVAAGTGLASLGGCLTNGEQSDTESPTQSDNESPKNTDETADNASSLTDWERSTDCDGEYDGMYDSIIRVERVTTSLDDGYAPIHFANLTAEEETILRTVTDDGGYGTCDTSDAFDRFVDRVADHHEQQGWDGHVYLARDGNYYGLYVEVLDQVYTD